MNETKLELNQEEAQQVFILIQGAFNDGFDDDELVSLYEKIAEYLDV